MNEMNGYDVEDLHAGHAGDVLEDHHRGRHRAVRGVSGDNNAMHVNEEFAATTRFGGRIAHGFLTASVISAAVANRLPGPGTIYLSQQLNFRAPVRIGQTVHASVSVSAIDRERRRVTLEDRVPRRRDGGDRRRGAGDDDLVREAPARRYCRGGPGAQPGLIHVRAAALRPSSRRNTMPNSSPTPVTETKIIMSDPTALGVFGLSMVTFVAASQKMGWTSGSVYLIPWALFLGSIAQIWASTIDFKKNNYFGAIVLGAYGLFWIAVAMHWAIGLGWLGAVGDKADPRQLGVACIGYFIFSLFIMVAAFEANKVFAAILLMINVLLPSLALSLFGINAPFFSVLAAYPNWRFRCSGSTARARYS